MSVKAFFLNDMKRLLLILIIPVLLSWDLSKRNVFTVYKGGTTDSYIYLSDSSKLEGDFNTHLLSGHTVITSTVHNKYGVLTATYTDTVSLQIASTDWEVYNDILNIHNLTPLDTL